MQETQETWVQLLGQEGPLEKGMATHSSIFENPMDRGTRRARTRRKQQSVHERHGRNKENTLAQSRRLPVTHRKTKTRNGQKVLPKS